MRDDNDLDAGDLAEQPDEQSDEIKLPPRPSAGQPETIKRVALLVKGEMLAVIALTRSPQANTVGCLDPRLRATTVQSFSDPERASATFHQAVRTSEGRGWRVFYLGAPMYG